MSMPGFVFYFRCETCDATSGGYSVFVFHDILRPEISLPAWSLKHKFWGSVNACLSADQRREMEADRDVLVSFAASMSSDSLTIGVPTLSPECDSSAQADSFGVSITPDPQCPNCGAPSTAIFGYPPREESHSPSLISAAEFRIAPIALIGLSARTSMICRELDLRTVGNIENSRARIAAHPRANEATVLEIDKLLARKPIAGT